MSPTESGARHELVAVDDNELVRRVIEDHFGSRGWSVVLASNGAEALECLGRRMPDVVVSDVLMPEMDGWAFYEAFRRLPGAESVPFVFLTVESDVPKRVRGLRLGADDYLPKPFDPRELHARIDRLLVRRAAMTAARQGEVALLQGTVEHLSLSDLLQLLALNGNDGTVLLEESGREGRVELERGSLVHAVAGEARGPKALYRMLGWSRARFQVVKRTEAIGPRSIEGAPTSILMDGLVALDDWRKVVSRLPAPDAWLRLLPEARERLHAATVGAVEFEILARVRSGATLQEVLDGIPVPDAEVGAAVASLLSRGILGAEAERPTGR